MQLRKRKKVEYTPPDHEEGDNEEDEDFIVEDGAEGGESQYFTLDTEPLRKIILDRLKKLGVKGKDQDLEKAIKESFDKTKDDVLGEYLGAVPNDTRWKADLPDEEAAELEPQLCEIRAHIKANIPTMDKILKARISDSEKIKAVELYDVLQNTEPYTEDYLSLRARLAMMIRDNDLSEDDVRAMNVEEEKFRNELKSRDLKQRIFFLKAPDETKKHIYEMYLKLEATDTSDPSYSTIKEKLLWAVSLPYEKREEMPIPKPPDGTDLTIEFRRAANDYLYEIKKTMDENLYGMEKVKEEVLLFVNNQLTNPKSTVSLCFEGPMGVGKTRLGSVIAKAMKRKFERIALGGLEDASIFKGVESHWLGSSPNILLHILKRASCSNPVVMFDEVDKLGVSQRGLEVQYALLHVTDFTQNQTFCDMFLSEFSHDVSAIFYIFGINKRDMIDPVLRDRLYIIEIPPYTRDEMIQIATRHLLPAALTEVGMAPNSVTISKEGYNTLFEMLGDEVKDHGVRPVEKAVRLLSAKVNMFRVHTIQPSKVTLSFTLPGFTQPYVLEPNVISSLMHVKAKPVLSYYS